MTRLPKEVKWNIWTFVNGEPRKNWESVLSELKKKINSNCFDMEEACQACNTVRWSKEMFSVRHQYFGSTKIFYCTTECLYKHYGKPINIRSLVFAI